LFKKHHPHVGARPGTLVISDDAPPPQIHIMRYTPERLWEAAVLQTDALKFEPAENEITWVDVQGFGDVHRIREIGELFSLHPLAMEDVVNVPQRPKAEAYEEQLLVVAKMVDATQPGHLIMEQVSIVLGKNYVLTFQEQYGDVLDPVRKRLRAAKGLIRRQGPDYLAYAIFDTIIDAYYPVLEATGNFLEELEDEVLGNPTPDLLRNLHQARNRLTNLRRAIWPQREAASRLCRDEYQLISPDVRIHLRDTHDHCVQTSEVIEMYREMISGLMNTYLSAVANRTNEVMKVLTIVSTIFIPLTFIAGVYGMNFEYMPELHVRWAYPLIWLTMIGTAGSMALFFFRKGWLGGNESTRDDD